MTEDDLRLYRGITAERDKYLKALRELVSVPNITIAEHIGETPWLKPILHDVANSN